MDQQQNATLPEPSATPHSPVQQATPPAPAVTPDTTSQPSTPPIADDGDLIEKEWVTQVKHVLQTNAGNPYEQNRQLASLRADYMQKRYGKHLKTGE